MWSWASRQEKDHAFPTTWSVDVRLTHVNLGTRYHHGLPRAGNQAEQSGSAVSNWSPHVQRTRATQRYKLLMCPQVELRTGTGISQKLGI